MLQLQLAGERIKFLRNVLNMTREDLCTPFKIPIISLRQAENCHYHLTEKFKERILKAFEHYGIFVSENFLSDEILKHLIVYVKNIGTIEVKLWDQK